MAMAAATLSLAVSTQVGADTSIALDANNTITLQNFTLANLDSWDFIFGAVVVAEDPEEILGADKASVAEDITVSDKPVISDDATLVEKAVVSDDDNFVFVEKQLVPEVLTGISTSFGDFVINQDIMAEFLAEAQILRYSYLGNDSALEAGHEIDTDLSYFTEFFGFL